MKKQMSWKTKGMNRDMSVSAFSPEFSFENRNLRLSTNEGNTMLSWVTEKGTKKVNLKYEINPWRDEEEEPEYQYNIWGYPIGTAVVGSKLVLFTHNTPHVDNIYVFQFEDAEKEQLTGERIFSGDLNFDFEHPLETLVSCESEKIQKVYWVDGINQPRMLTLGEGFKYNSADNFNFVGKIGGSYDVKVKKILGGGGLFAPGVIQYSFTYYRKNGHESNIFYTTPLYYISYNDRGGSPEDKIDNTFRITVNGVDYSNYDYIRIYSIQRTSLNGTPIVKRIQDVLLKDKDGNPLESIGFTDTGMTGESIDPTELLYKGGESIIANTLEQKDGTLFLGNIHIERNLIDEDWRDRVKTNANVVSKGTLWRKIILEGKFNTNTVSGYVYNSQLTAYAEDDRDRSVPCGGFKTGNYYRCGVQFQHETGRWSDPIYIKDVQVVARPNITKVDDVMQVKLPAMRGELDTDIAADLMELGYIKARAVVVFPNIGDRMVLCQGVVNPTMLTGAHRNYQDLYAQSSWFFRPRMSNDTKPKLNANAINPYNTTTEQSHTITYPIKYVSMDKYIGYTNVKAVSPEYARWAEVEGHFEPNNRFQIDNLCMTFNSPDIDFNDQYQALSFNNVRGRRIRNASFLRTLSDIEIQTDSPSISNRGSGFVHKTINSPGAAGIVSGLFYDDYLVDDHTTDNQEEGKDYDLMVYDREQSSCKWLVYLWQKDGSLNNDINRPAGKGTPSAILRKKIVSNMRVADNTNVNYPDANPNLFDFGNGTPQLFNSDQNTILKLTDLGIYRGNIDTVLTPDKESNVLFAFDAQSIKAADVTTDFESENWWCTNKYFHQDNEGGGSTEIRTILRYDNIGTENSAWVSDNTAEPQDIGGTYTDLVTKKDGVRMKYKSTPHIVLSLSNRNLDLFTATDSLPIVELVRGDFGGEEPTMLFGGKSDDALRENVWIPCGEPVALDNVTTHYAGGDNEYKSVDFYYSYGDTYFQRWDCLKTYAYTKEDVNQVVEIGSFMMESYTNMDGRYDRNRGQQSNLYMSPENFNLMNPVYSQIDNFFSYKIQDITHYSNTDFSNLITWTKTKESGADIDLWTNITLANVLELDGDKGKITSLQRFNNELLVFQESGLAQLMYNNNTLLSTTNGVPVEIANSDKVQGKNYISGSVGCSNKWSITTTPMGIYFIDGNEKSIYMFNGKLQNLSVSKGFNAWSKKNIAGPETIWNPREFNNFVTYYDKGNQEVLFINKYEALAYSEKFGTFTSFYDYGYSQYFCNLDDVGIWINGNLYAGIRYNPPRPPQYKCTIWKHQGGEYCNIFGNNVPYSMTLVGNPEAKQDCTFTNMEFRANVEGDSRLNVDVFDETFDATFHPGIEDRTFYLPFDQLETWNEYQHGYAKLSYKNGSASMKHFLKDGTAHLDRKFRMWRCDIPRDNWPLEIDDETGEDIPEIDNEKGIARYKAHPVDRMRNPWLYIKLEKKADRSGMKKAEIHDLVMTYYG